jgi:hypothetical protein
MISDASKPRDVLIIRKKDIQTIDEETKIPFFVIIFSSLDVLI